MVAYLVTLLACVAVTAVLWHLMSSWEWPMLIRIPLAIGAFIGTPYVLSMLHVGIDKQQLLNLATFSI